MSEETEEQQAQRHHNLIRSYGLLWDREKVQWKGREAGLPGRIRVKKTDNEPDQKRPETRQTTEAHILDALEAVAIEIADPNLNRQGGRLPNDAEYLQVPAKEEVEEPDPN